MSEYGARDLREVSILMALKNGWTEATRIEVLKAYEAFLAEAARSVRFVRPTLKVDELWHEHILHTQLYSRYCDDQFGRYIHHLACIPQDIKTRFEIDAGRSIRPIAELSAEARDGADGLVSHGAQLADCGQPAPPDLPKQLADCGPGGPPIRSAETPAFCQELSARSDCGAGKPC